MRIAMATVLLVGLALASAVSAQQPALAPLENVVQTAAGQFHTCALSSAGAVSCWGSNREGQLGARDPAGNLRESPVAVSGLGAGVVALAAGKAHSCALLQGGQVRCWGANDRGQLGDGSRVQRSQPVDVGSFSGPVTAIAAGEEHTCAVVAASRLVCWGRNDTGQLGDGSFEDRLRPTGVQGLDSGVSAVGAGHYHTCAVRNGGVSCWGRGEEGQLGDGQFGNRALPAGVPGLGAGMRAVGGGRFHACAVSLQGAVSCWGGNEFGQVGNGSLQTAALPVAVTGLGGGVRELSVNWLHSCAVRDGGETLCWGDNFFGQIGDGGSEPRTRPTQVSGFAGGADRLSAGYLHNCAVDTRRQVRCWGNNLDGQLGNGTFANRIVPRQVVGLTSGIERIATGFQHSCAWSAGGGTRCWGDNAFAQLGNGGRSGSEVPVQVQQLGDGSGVLAGGIYHTCSLTTAGGVKCWGQGRLGALGDGSFEDRLVPTQVSGLTSGVVGLAAGGFHTCAVRGNGEVLCWGVDSSGQLGVGDFGLVGAPTVVPGLPGPAAAVSAGEAHSCALTRDGAVYCWGANGSGQLGVGGFEPRPAPTRVLGLGAGVVAISVSGNYSCALIQGGAVRCWGANDFGQQGDGGSAARPTPGVVSGLESGVVAIEAAWFHACATRSGGAMSCWGRNIEGQIGDNSIRARPLPTPVAGLNAGVTAISAGGGQTCALRSGGQVRCWGANNFGQVGDGSSWAVRVPVSVVLDPRRRDVANLVPGADAPSTTAATDKSGRFVAFASSATNLVGGDSNGRVDVFRRDRESGSVTRVSLANNGAQLGGDAREPAISGDGQRIVFVAPDAAVAEVLGESFKARAQRLKNTGQGLFLRNMLTGTTQRVGDAQPQGGTTAPTVAGNGGSIAWTQPVSDPAQGTVGQQNVFIATLTPASGGAVTVSTPVCATCRVPGAGGQPTSLAANGASRNPSLSDDGRWLAFETDATNLDLGGGGKNVPCAGSTTVVLRDLLTGATRAASAPASGGSCGGSGVPPPAQPSVSGNGGAVAFQSGQPLVAGDDNGQADVYLWDATTGALTRVSVGAGGLDANGASTAPSVSSDGRSVAFVSSASNLDASFADNNDLPDVHVARIGTGVEIARLSLSDAGGEAGRESAAPAISGDGGRIAFESAAGNLAPGAVDDQLGVFLRANPLSSARDRAGVWWTPSESGWGLVTADQGEAVVVGWFTYDVDGEPMWVSGALTPQTDGSYRGQVSRNTGVPLAQISGQAAESSTVFAQVTLRFEGERALRFDYVLAGGPAQTKQMERFPFGPLELVCPPATAAERLAAGNYSDIWWGGAQTSGWGLFLTQIDARLFPVWFTYDVDREPIFYTGSGERQADGSFTGTLLRSRNGTPLAQINGSAASLGADAVGTFRFTPSNGISGDFAYVIGGTSQTRRIERFVFGSAPPLCRAQAVAR